MFRTATAIFAAIALTGCATANTSQRVPGEVLEGGSYEYTPEAEVARGSRKTERQIAGSSARITDPALVGYVEELTASVSGDFADELRVYLIEAPAFNAGILPNGAMLVYSGMLLRVDNEAELAQVLGHEFGHYYEKHGLKRQLRSANTEGLANTVGLAVGGLGHLAAAVVGKSALQSYSRSQELEADIVGLEVAADAGYDPNAAIQLWTNLQAEQAASSNEKARERSAKTKSARYDTHPTSTARIAALRKATAKLPTRPTGTNAAEYRQRIRPYLTRWYEAELMTRDYGSVLALVERKRGFGEDLGVLGYIEGAAYALRREPGDEALAMAAWEAAKQHSDAPAFLQGDLTELMKTMQAAVPKDLKGKDRKAKDKAATGTTTP